MTFEEEKSDDETFLNKYNRDFEKIDSFVTKSNAYCGEEVDLPDKIKFMSAFYPPYRKSQIRKTKYGDWRIKARSGNYTIRLFNNVRLHSISFKPIPNGFDCSIKLFRVLFASKGRVFRKSKVFQLEQNSSVSQAFPLSEQCESHVDAIKLEVIDNWGSVDSTCLFDYNLYKQND